MRLQLIDYYWNILAHFVRIWATKLNNRYEFEASVADNTRSRLFLSTPILKRT